MSELNDAEKSALLTLARSAIAAQLDPGETVNRPDPPTPTLSEKRGCFVTLHLNGALRGCIGSIEPVKPLVEGIEENALNAAFRDPRFPPLKPSELPEVHIEISVLTRPEPLAFSDPEDLKAKLKPGIHGVILSKGWRQSTFLPQVWEQLPSTDIFLGHLCQKAGMGPTCWRDDDIVVKTYEAKYFSE